MPDRSATAYLRSFLFLAQSLKSGKLKHVFCEQAIQLAVDWSTIEHCLTLDQASSQSIKLWKASQINQAAVCQTLDTFD